MRRLLTHPVCGSDLAPKFWLLVAVTATGTLAMHIFVPALPAAARDLARLATEIQLTVTLYLVGLAFGQLVYGPLSDRFGRRPTILVSLAIYSLGLALAIPTATIGPLIAARVMQALGACGSLVLGRAMVRDTSEGEDIVRRMATLMIVMTLTPMLAPALGGFISETLGWRAIFVILAISVAALLLVVVATLPETNRDLVPLPGIGSVVVGYGRLMLLPSYAGFAVAGACCTTSIYAFLAAAPFLFVDILHRSIDEVGVYCLIVIAGMIVGAAVARRFVSRFSVTAASRCGAVFCLIGALGLLAVDRAHMLSVAGVIAPMLVFAFGMGITSPNAVTGLMNAAPNAIGAASSLYGFVQMALGALFTLVVAFWHDGTALPTAVTLLLAALLAQIALLRA